LQKDVLLAGSSADNTDNFELFDNDGFHPRPAIGVSPEAGKSNNGFQDEACDTSNGRTAQFPIDRFKQYDDICLVQYFDSDLNRRLTRLSGMHIHEYQESQVSIRASFCCCDWGIAETA
jgi:hypothetical protein